MKLIAASVVVGLILFPGSVRAQKMLSEHYTLRASTVAAGIGSSLGGPTTHAVGTTIGDGASIGASVGGSTGITLVSGSWPAMVGAAFDQDRDLVPNVIDNCTLVRNTLQLDVGGDGYGNACDADITNDGIVNFADLAQLKRAFYTNDPIADLNGDHVVNFADLAIMKKAFFKKPGPAAGKP